MGRSIPELLALSNDGRVDIKCIVGAELTSSDTLFSCAGDDRVAVYEPEMIDHFDHRKTTFEGTEPNPTSGAEKKNIFFEPVPKYWSLEYDLLAKISPVPPDLVIAVQFKNKKKATSIIKMWFAGFNLNRGDAGDAKRAALGEQAIHELSASTFASPTYNAINYWRNQAGFRELEKKWPLTELDMAFVVWWGNEQGYQGSAAVDTIALSLALMREKAPQWLIAVRLSSRPSDRRTLVATVIPRSVVSDKAAVLVVGKSACSSATFIANSAAFVLDFSLRSRISDEVTTDDILGLPFLNSSAYAPSDYSFIACRTLELTHTSFDFSPFARDCGYDGEPFVWDDDRRFLLRCELDAAYFYLYGIERDDVDYIMETFPIVKRKDERAHGEYRTKRVILELYDRMADATRTGTPFQTWLDPRPAHGWTPPQVLIDEALRSVERNEERVSGDTSNMQPNVKASGRGRRVSGAVDLEMRNPDKEVGQGRLEM